MVSYLTSKQLYSYVDGSISQPFPSILGSSISPPLKIPTTLLGSNRTRRFSAPSSPPSPQMIGSNTAQEVWTALETLFASQSQARVIQLLYQLATIKKGISTIFDYICCSARWKHSQTPWQAQQLVNHPFPLISAYPVYILISFFNP